jgi:hypothetical protein
MTTLSTKAELLAVNMTCRPLSTTLVYYLLYITIVCPTLHFSSLVNHNSSILDQINTCALINREGLHLVWRDKMCVPSQCTIVRAVGQVSVQL